MSTIPRTPVHFPRMKVRGWRNKYKVRARYHRRIVIPAGTILSNDGGRYTINAGMPVGVATHRVEFDQWTDGYGRSVAPPPKPQPRRGARTTAVILDEVRVFPMKTSFSMSFKFERAEGFQDAIDLLTGGGSG